MLDLCRNPDLTVEATLQPVRRLAVDAAILFSDIVLPLDAMGVDLEVIEGVGPVIAHRLRCLDDVEALRTPDPEADLSYVLEAVATLAGELTVPLIGFAGAPFTLASYLVEGGPSRTHARTKALMYRAPEVWCRLMDRLATAAATYLRAQIDAGAAAIQLFDSWAGALDPGDYERYALPWVRRILAELDGLEAPRILFGVTTGELLGAMGDSGADVVGIDWRVPLDEARRRTGGRVVQGNLDPAACLAPWDVVEHKASEVLARGGGRGHVFNLGHGVLPETDPGVLRRLVDFVHSWTAADG